MRNCDPHKGYRSGKRHDTAGKKTGKKNHIYSEAFYVYTHALCTGLPHLIGVDRLCQKKHGKGSRKCHQTDHCNIFP